MSRLSKLAARLEERRITGMFGNNDPQDWSIELKEGVDPLCMEAAAALREAEQLLRSAFEDSVEGQHSGKTNKREWLSGGTWLYPGSRIVYLDRTDCERIRALIG